MRLIKRVLPWILGLVALFLATGALYEWRARSGVTSRYPPPGRLVDIGGRTLHLDCRGSGQPTVVFEAGLDPYGSLSWSAVHDSIARTTRACAYDRAGIMWSDPAPEGAFRDARAIAEDLRRLLDRSGESGPYVLVAHSLGGPYALVFTRSRPEAVAGAVFVDASHPDQFNRLRPAAGDVVERGRSVMRVTQVLATLGALRLILAWSPDRLPGLAPGQLQIAAAFMPQGLKAVMAEGDALDSSTAEARAATDLADRPLAVLSALRPFNQRERDELQLTEAEGIAVRAIWDTLHLEELRYSKKAWRVRLPDAGHYIQFDRPDMVIAAVREVVDSVRARQRSAPPGPRQ